MTLSYSQVPGLDTNSREYHKAEAVLAKARRARLVAHHERATRAMVQGKARAAGIDQIMDSAEHRRKRNRDYLVNGDESNAFGDTEAALNGTSFPR